MSFYKLIILFLLVAALGILQNTDILNVYGVKPNLILAFLIATSFFLDSIPLFLLLVIVSAVFLRFSGGWEWELLVLAVLVVFAAWTGRIIAWRPVFSVAFLIGIGTMLFYLAVGRQFLLAAWPTVLGEMGYNAILGVLVYKWLSYEKNNDRTKY